MAHNVTIQNHTNKVEAPLEITGKNLHSVYLAFSSSKTYLLEIENLKK